MKPLVKICGVTLAADALAVASAGVHYIGLNLWHGSKRHLPVEHAAKLAAVVRASSYPAQIVGVFVDTAPEVIARSAETVGLDVIQLHGDETPEDCALIAAATGARVWKAIAVTGVDAVADLQRWPVDAILLDAPAAGRGGSGTRFDWSLARRAVVAEPARRFVLAGGLTAEVVAGAVAAVAPWAVDVASGVEVSPGIKDHAQVRAFVAAVRGQGG